MPSLRRSSHTTCGRKIKATFSSHGLPPPCPSLPRVFITPRLSFLPHSSSFLYEPSVFHTLPPCPAAPLTSSSFARPRICTENIYSISSPEVLLFYASAQKGCWWGLVHRFLTRCVARAIEQCLGKLCWSRPGVVGHRHLDGGGQGYQ